MEKYTKEDLINVVSDKGELTKVEAKKNIELVLSTILEMGKDKGIVLRGFGTLQYRRRAARNICHIKTKERVTIPEGKVLNFKMSEVA